MRYSEVVPLDMGNIHGMCLEIETADGPVRRAVKVRTPDFKPPSARQQLQMRVKLLEWALGCLTALTSDDHDTNTMWV